MKRLTKQQIDSLPGLLVKSMYSYMNHGFFSIVKTESGNFHIVFTDDSIDDKGNELLHRAYTAEHAAKALLSYVHMPRYNMYASGVITSASGTFFHSSHMIQNKTKLWDYAIFCPLNWGHYFVYSDEVTGERIYKIGFLRGDNGHIDYNFTGHESKELHGMTQYILDNLINKHIDTTQTK